MNLKRWLCAVVATVYLVCLPVGAHSGGTDSFGGHYDRSAGEYHHHHGYPAHAHVDGECPYDFQDANRSEAEYESEPIKEPEPEEEEHEQPLWKKVVGYAIGLLLGVPYALALLWYAFAPLIKLFQKKKRK